MDEDKFSIQTLSKELNATNNSKEGMCQRVVAAKIAYAQKEVELERLNKYIVAFAAAFNEKLGAEIFAANMLPSSRSSPCMLLS
jgi:hypothetical protein